MPTLRSAVRALLIAALALSVSTPTYAQLAKTIAVSPNAAPSPFVLLVHASVSSSSGGGGETITTGAIDTSGAKLLVCIAAYYNAGGDGSTNDSKSNTWVARTNYGTGGAVHAQIFYVVNPASVGSGHTFSFNRPAGSLYPSFGCAAFSAGGTVAYDTENGTASASATSLATGSVTPATTNEVLISAVGIGGGLTFSSVDSGFSTLDSIANLSSNHYGFVNAYIIETSVAAKNPTWSTSGSASDLAVTIAAFKNH